MLKTISASDLRAQMKRVLNEVTRDRCRYVIERFGEPTAAVVSIDDLRLLETVKLQRLPRSRAEAPSPLHGRRGGNRPTLGLTP